MELSTVPNAWDLADVICKFLFYIGAASALGTAVSLLLYGDSNRHRVDSILFYQLIGALLGFHGTLGYFLVQAGKINASGISGAFDWAMLQILLDTPIGDVALYRLFGFAWLIATSVLLLRKAEQSAAAPTLSIYRFNLLISCFGFAVLLMSFRYGGHVSVLSWPMRLVLAFHFTGFAIWIGSLYPLLILTANDDKQQLQRMLQNFSNHAIFYAGTLLLAGLLLSLKLIHAPAELINTDYGQALSIKLTLVLGLLGIAALNRFRLVPALLRQQGVAAFRLSLRIEILAATAILLVTAWLSTVVGPAPH